MTRIFKTAALAGLCALFAAPRSYGQEPDSQHTAAAPAAPMQAADHLTEAIKQTQAAIEAGNSGQNDLVVEHAQEALTHAQAAKKEKPSPNLDAAIKSLKSAVKQGQQGKTTTAMKAAQAALQKLQA